MIISNEDIAKATEEQLDEYLAALTNSDSIYASQKAADDEYSKITESEWKALRIMAKTDLFFLSYSILDFTRISPNLHGHLCEWMKRNAGWQFKEELLPRGHFKSSLITIADSIQIVLPDDTETEAWPRNLGPNCKLLIGHETDLQASKFLFAITQHFLSNPKLIGLFPECVPSRKQRINQHQLELPRELRSPEPTIDTMGVGGKSQGRHYNYLKLDDLIGDKARDSVALMEAAKQWFDNIQSFFDNFDKDHFDLVGTRWSLDDLYDHVHERYGDQLLRYIRGVEEPTGSLDELGDPEMQTIFPEEFSPLKLEILRKNKKVFSAQYANSPLAGAGAFEASWKTYYNWVDRHQREIAIFTGHQRERILVKDLDVCVLFDPAMSGKMGLVVTGTDEKDRIFVLDAIKDEWKPPQACEEIFKLVRRWNPRTVAIEEVLFSGLFRPWFETEMKLRQFYFNITPVEPLEGGRKISKEMRVRGLTNYFSARRIFFHPNQVELIKEFDHFGATDDYHILDSLAYGPEVWMPGMPKSQKEHFKQQEEEILAGQDITTGYSAM